MKARLTVVPVGDNGIKPAVKFDPRSSCRDSNGPWAPATKVDPNRNIARLTPTYTDVHRVELPTVIVSVF